MDPNLPDRLAAMESHGKGNLTWLTQREPRVGTGFENTGPSSRYTNGFLNVQRVLEWEAGVRRRGIPKPYIVVHVYV